MRAPRILATSIGLILACAISADLHAARPSTGGSGGGGGKSKGSSSTADTTPPALAVPGDISLEATGPTGAMAIFTATATDNVDGAITPSCSPASGSSFPLGRTSVSCQARDASGNRSVAVFSVAVRDTAAPTIGLPGPVSIQTPDQTGSTVDFTVTVLDRVDPSPNVGCYPDSGSRFAIGTTMVHCSASDSSGNNTTEDFQVTVAVSATAAAPPPPAPPSGFAALSWSVPTTRADGTPITLGELAGYELYVLSESDGATRIITIDDPLATRYTLGGLATDVYHFAIGAVDSTGHLSELSAVVSKQVP